MSTPALVSNPTWRQARNHLGLVAGFGRHGCPSAVLRFGGGLGDELLLTCLARELAGRGEKRIWVSSRYPEIFAGNPDVRHVVPELVKGSRYLIQATGGRVISASYAFHVPAERRDLPPERHILALMGALAGLRGLVKFRPYLELSPEEQEWGRRLGGRVVIQNTGLSARYPIRTKEWLPERFQEVVNQLKGSVDFIQLGQPSDPSISGALDLRGKTTIRESAAILANSRLFVGLVGFLMHVSRAVDCPAVIVYGGRELPQQTGYICNTNIVGQAPCSPCWHYDSCAGNHMCMEQIQTSTVVGEIAKALTSRPADLPVEEYHL